MTATTPHRDVHIAILLPDRFADWETALLGAVARAFLGVRIRHVTRDGHPVESMAGLRVEPDTALTDPALHGADALILCGGEGWSRPGAPDAQALVERVRLAGGTVGGICDGVVGLARAGLLDENRHTGNCREDLVAVRGYRGHGGFVESVAAVSDGRVVTAPGTAPVSFAREVLMSVVPEQQRDVDDFLRLYTREHSLLA